MYPRWQRILTAGAFSAVLLVMTLGSFALVTAGIHAFGWLPAVGYVLPLFSFSVLTLWGGDFIQELKSLYRRR
jgi:hypothetical protein